MNANNLNNHIVKQFDFKEYKINKNDTIYQGLESNSKNSFFTEFVKIEKYQGYSNAYNLGLYFRIKNESSWLKSKQITGLWKTETKGVYYGDYKEGKIKTLLFFKLSFKNDFLRVIEYPKGFYPSKTTIEKLASKI